MRNQGQQQRLRSPNQPRVGELFSRVTSEKTYQNKLTPVAGQQYGDPESVSPLCGTWISLYQLEKDSMVRATSASGFSLLPCTTSLFRELGTQLIFVTPFASSHDIR